MPQEYNFTIKSCKTYNPSKGWLWNIIRMPICSKCHKRYGSDLWNDNDNISTGKKKANAPIELSRYGLVYYLCPECYSENKKDSHEK